MASLAGINIRFPIYKDVNGVRTPFENLVLKKSTVDSVLMSLSDNITGDVYYKDNTLAVTMQEYIIYNDVKYVLVSPPTIVREGLVSNNSDTKGMTKYSFTFYHPMYQLNNMPFTDIAVQSSELRYKSENKSFSWIGYLEDFVAKLNKNLENTEWIVDISDRVSQDVLTTLSEVLSFDNVTIADALKTAYDTWEVPYMIDSIRSGEIYYSQGKRFLILIGLPSNEIYASDEDELSGNPFIFRLGKGVGLKNNSATPRNNKIVTRIAGYGSERNIPYGYPQIGWYGTPDWEFTINNDGDNPLSYPIYNGIVGGQWVRLIKHPFTRKHLMPSIYSQCVFNKVSPYLPDGTANPDYNPTIEIVDYYDAVDPSVYPNTIVTSAPSYEIHEFEKTYPELGEERIIAAYPIDNNGNIVEDWDDSDDGEGNYVQSYFKIKLPVLSFDIYACAAITEEMQINMRSGACIGCTFTVQVDWDSYKANFYDSDGNFAPNGSQRNYSLFPDSTQGQITITLEKETATFGVLMPNMYQYPKGETASGQGDGDQFVILGISLPLSYITNAETRLDDEMRSFMLENNVHYFDYPLKFDEKFLYDNVHILQQIKNNSIIRFAFADEELELYVKQITIKFNESPLPQYDITLTDDVEVVLNQIGQTQEELKKINSLLYELRKSYDQNVWVELSKKLSKATNDTARGRITFANGFDAETPSTTKGITNDGIFDTNGQVIIGKNDPTVEGNPWTKSRNFFSGFSGWGIDNFGNGELESLTVRSFLEVTELLINRLQAQEGDTLFSDNDQIEAVTPVTETIDGEEVVTSYILTLKEKWDGYFTAQQYGNVIKGIINTLAATSVSNVNEEDCVETDGANKYYTSWMYVTGDRNTEPNILNKNQIRVALYGDNLVPAQKNFPPCELMTIARWGCIDYGDPISDSDTPQEKARKQAILDSIEKRQRLFYLSASDGRIVKMRKVNSPILRQENYGTTLGTLPEFLYQWREVAEKALPGRDYLYAQGIVVQSLVQVYPNGDPKQVYVDCGDWVDGNNFVPYVEDGVTVEEPPVGHGTYLCYEWNPVSEQWETHDVWHNGCKWRALQHQPVTSGNVVTYYEPKWNSQYWKLVEGDDSFAMYLTSSKGQLFRPGYVETTVTPYVYYGNMDISNDLTSSYWSWTRHTENSVDAHGNPIYTEADLTWNANHTQTRVLDLTNSDMPVAWSRENRAVFTCTATISDGNNTVIVQNQVIA